MKVPTYEQIKCPTCKNELRKVIGHNVLCHHCLCKIGPDNLIWKKQITKEEKK